MIQGAAPASELSKCISRSDLAEQRAEERTFFVRRVLMTEDLPTLGYPTKPTLMYFLSERRRDNCSTQTITRVNPALILRSAHLEAMHRKSNDAQAGNTDGGLYILLTNKPLTAK